MMIVISGFTYFGDEKSDKFDINDLYDYQKEFKTEELSVKIVDKTSDKISYFVLFSGHETRQFVYSPKHIIY